MRSKVLWSTLVTFGSLIALIALLMISPPGFQHSRISWAFLQLDDLRVAISMFQSDRGQLPESLEQMAASGYVLHGVPSDPWSKTYIYRAYSHRFEIYSAGQNGIDEFGAGDDVTDREKQYSCLDYDVACPHSLARVLQAVLALLVGVGSLYLLALLAISSLRWARRHGDSYF